MHLTSMLRLKMQLPHNRDNHNIGRCGWTPQMASSRLKDGKNPSNSDPQGTHPLNVHSSLPNLVWISPRE